MRYHLRTLVILLAILPPLLWFGWTKYEDWRAERARPRAVLKSGKVVVIFDEPLWSPMQQPLPVTVPEDPRSSRPSAYAGGAFLRAATSRAK
jgi:hypothetical protein